MQLRDVDNTWNCRHKRKCRWLQPAGHKCWRDYGSSFITVFHHSKNQLNASIRGHISRWEGSQSIFGQWSLRYSQTPSSDEEGIYPFPIPPPHTPSLSFKKSPKIQQLITIEWNNLVNIENSCFNSQSANFMTKFRIDLLYITNNFWRCQWTSTRQILNRFSA